MLLKAFFKSLISYTRFTISVKINLQQLQLRNQNPAGKRTAFFTVENVVILYDVFMIVFLIIVRLHLFYNINRIMGIYSIHIVDIGMVISFTYCFRIGSNSEILLLFHHSTIFSGRFALSFIVLIIAGVHIR